MKTINGYSKTDVYLQLEAHMQKRDYQTVCCLMAELVCTRNEVASFLIHMCHYYTKFCMTQNIWLPNFILETCEDILRLPKRKLVHTEPLQTLVCRLTLVLTQAPTKLHTHLFNPKYAQHINVIEPHLYKSNTLSYQRLVEKLIGPYLTNEACKWCALLFYFVKARQRKESIILLNYLIHPDVCGAIKDPPNAPQPQTVKQGAQCDMVWPLWMLAKEVADQSESQAREHVEILWRLFIFQYSPPMKQTRINMLFMAYMACIKPEGLHVHPVHSDIIEKACTKIHHAFGEVLHVEFDRDAQKHAKADKPVQAKQQPKAKPKPTIVQDDEDQSYKYDYLKFFTYYPDSDGEIERPRNISSSPVRDIECPMPSSS